MKLRLPKNRKLRWLLLLGTPALLFFAFCIGHYCYTDQQSAAELRAEIARLDAEDPGWDWDSFLRNRPEIPDDQNSYALLAKFMALPAARPNYVDLDLTRWRVSPEPLLPIEVADWAGELVVERAESLRVARQFSRFPNGRHPTKFSPDLVSTVIETVQITRFVTRLLQWDGRVNAQLGRFDACIEDIRAIRNVARSIGDEPWRIPFLVRVSIETTAARLTDEMLSQGVAPEAGLERLQKELIEESRQPYLVHALRTERASDLKTMEYYGTGAERGNLVLFEALVGGPPRPRSRLDPVREYSMSLRYPALSRSDQAHYLRRMLIVIEAAEFSGPARTARLAEIEGERKRESANYDDAFPDPRFYMSQILLFGMEKLSAAEMRWHAALRSAATGIAAERFRMAVGRWPDSLEELVPRFHDRVEEDPFTAKPLTYKKFADGVAIYSVGPDLKDDGGDVNGKVATAGRERGDYDYAYPTDLGIRLWDVERRGR